MFDDDDDDFAENKLNEDIEYFEAHLKGESIGFMESDRLEALIDHYLLVGQYAKARSASEINMLKHVRHQKWPTIIFIIMIYLN